MAEAQCEHIITGTQAASVANSKLAAWGIPADVCMDVTNPGDSTGYA